MPYMADLTARHPSIAPGAYGWIPDGWVSLFEAMLVELDGVLAAHPGVRLAIHDAKPKLARLSVFATLVPDQGRTGLLERVREAAARAEERSAATCDVCGEPGHLRADVSGWLATRCVAHTGHE